MTVPRTARQQRFDRAACPVARLHGSTHPNARTNSNNSRPARWRAQRPQPSVACYRAWPAQAGRPPAFRAQAKQSAALIRGCALIQPLPVCVSRGIVCALGLAAFFKANVRALLRPALVDRLQTPLGALARGANRFL